MVGVGGEHSSERALQVIALDGIDVDYPAKLSPADHPADTLPEGIEQLIMSNTDQTRTAFRSVKQRACLCRVDGEGLLDVDMRAGVHGLQSHRRVRLGRRRDMNHVRPRLGQQPAQIIEADRKSTRLNSS